MASNPASPLIDDPHAPELFADEAVGVLLHNGNIHITFAATRSDHGSDPAKVNRVVMGRLVMPAGAADAMQKLLGDFIKRLQAQAAGATPASQTVQ